MTQSNVIPINQEQTPEQELSQWPLAKLLRFGFDLKQAQDDGKQALADINHELERRAQFVGGKSTAHLEANGLKATITLKTNTKYDQAKLLQVKDNPTTADIFAKAFKPEYKPLGAAELNVYMKDNAEFANAVLWARTTTPGAPSVSYKQVEG